MKNESICIFLSTELTFTDKLAWDSLKLVCVITSNQIVAIRWWLGCTDFSRVLMPKIENGDHKTEKGPHGDPCGSSGQSEKNHILGPDFFRKRSRYLSIMGPNFDKLRSPLHAGAKMSLSEELATLVTLYLNKCNPGKIERSVYFRFTHVLENTIFNQ